MKKAGETVAGQAADMLNSAADPNVTKALSRLQKTLDDPRTKEKQRQRQQDQEQLIKARQSAQIIQLPLWPETKRGVPNVAFRGALFAAVKGQSRKYIENDLLATQEGYQISFTGKQLNQFDLDVWETGLHIADQQQINLGTECRGSIYNFLKIMGKTNAGTNRKYLDGAITRLTACEVKIKGARYSFRGNLIHRFYQDEATDQYVMILNPDLVKLYRAGYTQIEYNDIKKLGQKNLAKWLYRYYASHVKPYPLTIDKIRALCGSTNPHKGSFTRDLKNALQSLVDIGFLQAFSINGGKVYVQRA